MTDWTIWSSCPVTCGTGTQSRERSCHFENNDHTATIDDTGCAEGFQNGYHDTQECSMPSCRKFFTSHISFITIWHELHSQRTYVFCFRLTSAHIQPFGLHGLIQHRVLKAALQVKKVRLEIVIAMIKLSIFQIAMALTPERRNAIPKDVVS